MRCISPLRGPWGLPREPGRNAPAFASPRPFTPRFAEYVQARIGLPVRPIYAWMRRFHAAGAGMMVATQSLREELAGRGFQNIRCWSRGVDLGLFKPGDNSVTQREDWGLPRPIFLYVGRVAIEKNIRAFLALELPGSKVVVGGGPQLSALRREYPTVHFTGPRHGDALAQAYAGGDVFMFPSLTDTFGLVILEALACGTPVAAFPVTGPKDVLLAANEKVGSVNVDLRHAALEALSVDRAACRRHAELYSWRACAEVFLSHLVPINGG